jgi:hypothetical protein
MAAKAKTWVWIVVAVIALGMLGVIAVAGVGLYFFSRHVETEAINADDAETRFADVRQRYEKARPLIELDDRGELLRTNPARQASPDAPTPTALYVMAYDAGDSRIVRLSVPFWLLRLQKGGHATVDLGGRRLDLEELKLTVEDLERLGPALILDHHDARGARVLVWSQ